MLHQWTLTSPQPNSCPHTALQSHWCEQHTMQPQVSGLRTVFAGQFLWQARTRASLDLATLLSFADLLTYWTIFKTNCSRIQPQSSLPLCLLARHRKHVAPQNHRWPRQPEQCCDLPAKREAKSGRSCARIVKTLSFLMYPIKSH